MGTTGKIVAGGVVAVVAVVIVVATLVVSNLDDIIRKAVESVGTEVTGTRVSLDAVKFSLTDGRGEFHGLSIANPPGYTTENAFHMTEIAIQVDPGSLAGKVIVIDEILIDGALVVAEQKAVSTNLKELLANVEQSGSQDPSSSAAAEDSAAAQVRLMVKKFSFINNSASIVTEQWGTKTLSIPDVNMQNIGDRETGLTPQELATTMTTALMRQAEQAAQDYLAKLVKDAAKKELEKQLDQNLDEDDKARLKGLKSMFDK